MTPSLWPDVGGWIREFDLWGVPRAASPPYRLKEGQGWTSPPMHKTTFTEYHERWGNGNVLFEENK